METYFVRVAADIGAVLAKLANDLWLFSTAEFDFCRLPDALTTGSSIMPQKRNADVLELLRAHAARLPARLVELARDEDVGRGDVTSLVCVPESARGSADQSLPSGPKSSGLIRAGSA